MTRIVDLKHSGHWPSLLAAFLHFDTSFMVWVILGAIAPFIALDVTVTGPSLTITPLAGVAAGRYVLATGPAATAAHAAPGAYRLTIWRAGTAASAHTRPVEAYTLDNAQPATLVALNRQSRLIRVTPAGAHAPAPHQQTVSLQSSAQLRAHGRAEQVVARGLSASAKGLLIALPLLGTALFRILLGLLSDRYGSKRIGTLSLALTLVPLLVGWQWATSYTLLLCMGAFLGLAGGSFAVTLPLAARWYPPHLQGLALGIVGAGNSGTVIATLAAPLLAGALGWHAVLGLLMVPVSAVLLAFVLLARDAPGAPKARPLSSYRLLLGQRDTYVFCLLYFVTFGGFLGLSSFLNTFFVDQYHLARAVVGVATLPFVLIGSLLRPVGGGLADRLGGTRVLGLVYSAVAAALVGVGVALASGAIAGVLLLVAMGCLGMGNGAVFQVVPQRFRGEIGAITGLVGAVGGVGGFYLNVILGNLKDGTGTYATGFWVFAVTALAALVVLRLAARSWYWLAAGGRVRHVYDGHDAVAAHMVDVGEAV
jgi:NNP family nitrate/nitrite transporter-like MFS transporter